MSVDVASLLRRWLPIALVCAALTLLTYVTVQQSLRTGADTPQVQIAEDMQRALDRGVPPARALAQMLLRDSVEVVESLAPFAIIYDSSGSPLVGSGTLRGRLPAPPAGVLSYTREHGEERVTWRPESGVRLAAVVRYTSANGGRFVLAARSLRDTQQRISYVLQACLAALGVAALGSLAMLAMGDAILGTES